MFRNDFKTCRSFATYLKKCRKRATIVFCTTKKQFSKSNKKSVKRKQIGCTRLGELMHDADQVGKIHDTNQLFPPANAITQFKEQKIPVTCHERFLFAKRKMS